MAFSANLLLSASSSSSASSTSLPALLFLLLRHSDHESEFKATESLDRTGQRKQNTFALPKEERESVCECEREEEEERQVQPVAKRSIPSLKQAFSDGIRILI